MLALFSLALLVLLGAAGPAYGQEQAACEEGLPRTPELLFDFDYLRSVSDPTRFEGLEIASIEVVTLPIFNTLNPREDHRVYDFVNSIHASTRPSVVRQQLVIAEGEPLSAQRVEESERLLRANSYFLDAAVVPWRVCGDKVDVLVVTRDLWTLLPKFSFSRTGGSNEWGLEIEDTNVLGTGTQLSFAYYSERERDTARIFYRNPNVAGSRVVLALRYGESSDGYDRGIELAQPFFSLDAPWSAGLNLRQWKLAETLEQEGLLVNGFDHTRNYYSVYGARSTGLVQNSVRRYWLGFTHSEDIFDANAASVAQPPADRILAYPWVAASLGENEYSLYRNLNSLYRTEDVPTGVSATVLLGWADEVFNSELSQWVIEARYGNTPIKTHKHLWRIGLNVDGNWDRDRRAFVNTVGTIDTSYHYLLSDRWREFVAFRYDYGQNLDQDELLPLGGDQGLRGYPSEFALGEQRLILNLEQRYYFKAHWLNLFRFGALVFFDAGQTWRDQGNSQTDAELLKSVGVGLRVNSSKTNIGKIVHLDLAFPLDQQDLVDPYQWTIKAEGTF